MDVLRDKFKVQINVREKPFCLPSVSPSVRPAAAAAAARLLEFLAMASKLPGSEPWACTGYAT